MSIPESIYQRLYDAFIEGDEDEAEAVTVKALEAGVDPLAIINEVMIPALSEVGRRFQSGEFFLPELMMAGEAAEVVSKHLEEAISLSRAFLEKSLDEVDEMVKRIIAEREANRGY